MGRRNPDWHQGCLSLQGDIAPAFSVPGTDYVVCAKDQDRQAMNFGMGPQLRGWRPAAQAHWWVSADRLACSSVRRVFAEVSVQQFAAHRKSRSVLVVVVAFLEVVVLWSP